jgi:PAS domain S-box-containing protein
MLAIPSELARLALEEAPDAMIISSASGTIVFANLRAGALFGCDRAELIGCAVDSLLPEPLRARHSALRAAYLRRPHARPMGRGLELTGRRRDGTEIALEISLSPIEGADGLLIAAAIRDASGRKRIERELIAARDAAEQACTAAEQARERALRAGRAKSRFLATASHDLRQPLQTLALLNGTLRRVVADAEVAQILTQQEQAIGAMARLINALLDISKLESGAVTPAPVDFPVAAIFEEIKREFAGVAAAKQLTLEITAAPVRAHSDPSLIEQVLRNLVSNAIKYTCRGKVALNCLPMPGSLLRLEVLDTGIGIPASELACIYDEFYQVDAPANRARDGYGLGLSIVKRIVELLGLRLQVHSQPGEGSSFSLLLPAAAGLEAPPRPAAAPAAAVAGRGREQRVLLVEDDAAVRDATRMLLSVEGYRVTPVATLEEALQVATADVDILVTDYHLANGRTGTQVITALRERLGRSLKAVLVTADTSRSIRDLPRDPDLCIASKPLQAEEMLTMLSALSAGT